MFEIVAHGDAQVREPCTGGGAAAARGVDHGVGGHGTAALDDHAHRPYGPRGPPFDPQSAHGRAVPDLDAGRRARRPVEGQLQRRTAAPEGDQFLVALPAGAVPDADGHVLGQVHESGARAQHLVQDLRGVGTQHLDAEARQIVRVRGLRHGRPVPAFGGRCEGALGRGRAPFQDDGPVSGGAEGECGGRPGEAASRDDGVGEDSFARLPPRGVRALVVRPRRPHSCRPRRAAARNSRPGDARPRPPGTRVRSCGTGYADLR
ncbi:hypothetical protein GCM10009801_36340 [Streptomyces albiaxialis]|uniref:Uncharacterized protein n=1 Tax=Streptomyces albiaxialis TaxID=329523 RepID=A0ABN2VZT3_9ACTN